MNDLLVANNVTSLGLGVQSTWLYYASSMGFLPQPDVAIFIDLGAEKRKTLKYLEYLLGWAEYYSDIPIQVIKRKNLFKDLLNSINSTGQRFSSIPAYTKNEDGTTGMLRRQCTSEYKIEQVDTAIRKYYNDGLNMRGRNINVWQGITLDEIDRMSIPQTQWKNHVYPFCDYIITNKGSSQAGLNYKMNRNDVIAQYLHHKLPIPPKSSCFFCPYLSEAMWLEMKMEDPEDFANAVLIDYAIRDSSNKGIKQKVFLHQSCQPLDEVKFDTNQMQLFHGECSGMCHV